MVITGRGDVVKLLILINFVDRPHCSKSMIEKIAGFYRSRDVEFRIVPFQSREQSAREIDLAADRGFDRIMIGGGDGTIHHIVNLAFDKGFSFGLLPLGTVNALCRSLGIPWKKPLEACRIGLEGKEIGIDIGRIKDRYFTCFASIGFDASVVSTIQEHHKIAWERAAFGLQGVRRLFQLSDISRFSVNSESVPEGTTGHSMIISNIRNYAGFNFFKGNLSDSRMEMILFRKNTIPSYLTSVAKMFFPRRYGKNHDPHILRTDFRDMGICSENRLYLQMDGEPTPLEPGEEIKVHILSRKARFMAP